MCLVEVEGQRGLLPACTTPCTDEMIAHTDSPIVRQVQESVLELLLVNHPLDCPVCDKGGECPLQDQTMAYGPGESRFVEEKRHYLKPIALSDLVLLDRERCILCDRCTRFADEIAGDPLIAFVERGNKTHVLTFPDEPFRSYFSGNTIEICPVGALTAVPYRFKARPWDLEEVESTCLQCAVGCRIKLQSSTSRVLRVLGMDSEEVNQGWLCDKGRFSFEYLHHEERLRVPLVRDGDGFVETSWGEALEVAADAIKRAASSGSDALGFVGGARSVTESAYALQYLARTSGSNSVDCRLEDALEASFMMTATPRAQISDLDSADLIILVGPDLKEELPVLYLRVKRAAQQGGIPLLECSPMRTGLSKYASATLIYRSGEAAQLLSAMKQALSGEKIDRLPAGVDAGAFQKAIALVEERAGGNCVLIVGRPSLSSTDSNLGNSAARFASAIEARILPVAARSNVFGALLAGCAPNLLPGAVSIANNEIRTRFGREWGAEISARPGCGTREIFVNAATGKVAVLLLMGADPLTDLPDRSLALEALGRAGFVIAIDIFMTQSASAADVIFPAATFGEQSGTVSNIEGRLTWLSPKVAPPGQAQPEWYILDQIAARVRGSNPRWGAAEEVFKEMANHAPAFAGLDSATVKFAGTSGCLLDCARGGEYYTPVPLEDVPIAADQYNHRVIAIRKLYGDGAVTTHCPAFRRIDMSAVARLNGRDVARLGVSDGSRIRMKGSRADLEIEVIADAAVPEGSIALPFNRGIVHSADRGSGNDALPTRVSDLIDSSLPATEVRLETLEGER